MERDKGGGGGGGGAGFKLSAPSASGLMFR